MQRRLRASSRTCARTTKEGRTNEAVFADALEWRNEWRAEIEAKARGEAEPYGEPRNEADATARFAAALARAELKRFHWDARQEKEFQRLKNGRWRSSR